MGRDFVRLDGRSVFNPHEDVIGAPIPQTGSVTGVPVGIPPEVMEMIEEGKRLQGISLVFLGWLPADTLPLTFSEGFIFRNGDPLPFLVIRRSVWSFTG